MPKLLAFVRLPEGRLWHVEGARRLTACGRPVVAGDPGDGRVCEVLDGHVPSGAWVCPRCRDDLAAQLAAVDMAMAADPRRRKSPQKPLPWWLTPRSWSAEAIWQEVSAECDGKHFTCETYVSWLMSEHLHPYGVWPHLSAWRTRELVA